MSTLDLSLRVDVEPGALCEFMADPENERFWNPDLHAGEARGPRLATAQLTRIKRWWCASPLAAVQRKSTQDAQRLAGVGVGSISTLSLPRDRGCSGRCPNPRGAAT
jgi:hypothetical protein